MRTSLLVLVFVCGCLDRPLSPVEPCVTTGFVTSIGQPRVARVDLLFVVDDSPSMAEEQTTLAAQIPRLVRILATGDRDLDGTPDFTPVADLHAGVVTVNMGVGGNADVDTCLRNPEYGDDGILVNAPRVGGAGCAASYPRFLSFDSLTTNAAQFATDFTCLARTGTGGCGFEQQLDAPLKALLPGSSPITFYAGTHGHGDDAATNGGFLRSDSLIVVVDITDEDDCSTDVTDIWSKRPVSHTGDMNLRCIDYANELYDVNQRFVNGLRSLRPGDPNGVIFATITGVPQDLVTLPIDYDRLFADPRMQNHVTTRADGTRTLDPACTSTSGNAAPGIRMARVAQGFGANGIVQSICSNDYGPALGLVVDRIANLLDGVCLPRQLQLDADGKAGCDVVESFRPASDGTRPQTCADIAGADPTPVRIDADGTLRCRVGEIAVPAGVRTAGGIPSGTGWYYDDYTRATVARCGQRVAFTADAIPPGGVSVGLECLARVQSTAIACRTNADCPSSLACDATGTCVNPVCL